MKFFQILKVFKIIFKKQLRTIGAEKKRLSPLDSQIFAESLKQIRLHIAPKNAAAFQDYIEVHMKQILKMTKQWEKEKWKLF